MPGVHYIWTLPALWVVSCQLAHHASNKPSAQVLLRSPTLQNGEVGELNEIFQWRGEVTPGLPDFSAAERQHVGEEISDVLLYLVRLADVCGLDLAACACVL